MRCYKILNKELTSRDVHLPPDKRINYKRGLNVHKNMFVYTDILTAASFVSFNSILWECEAFSLRRARDAMAYSNVYTFGRVVGRIKTKRIDYLANELTLIQPLVVYGKPCMINTIIDPNMPTATMEVAGVPFTYYRAEYFGVALYFYQEKTNANG